MKNLQIIIKSNSKISIFQFKTFLKKYFLNNGFILYKICIQKLKNKKLAILKSPHVNKTAQEQFQKKTFKIKITLKSYKFFWYLKLFKKLNFNFVSDSSLYLKYNICNKKNMKIKTTLFNIINFKTNKYYNNYIFYKKRTNNFLKQNYCINSNILYLLKLFDAIGELLKNTLN